MVTLTSVLDLVVLNVWLFLHATESPTSHFLPHAHFFVTGTSPPPPSSPLSPPTSRFPHPSGSRLRSTERFTSALASSDILCPNGKTSGLITSFYVRGLLQAKNCANLLEDLLTACSILACLPPHLLLALGCSRTSLLGKRLMRHVAAPSLTMQQLTA